MPGFSQNFSNLPPGCTDSDIEQQTKTVSYAWYCSGVPRPASKAEWTTNALRFATPEEAQRYGDDLGSRWFAMGDGEVRETSDPVTYALIDNILTRIAD